MKILNVAYPFAPVSANSVGGAEQITHQIVDALARAGHESTLIAREDSKVPGELIPIPIAQGQLNDPAVREKTYAEVRAALARTDADLIHFHGIDFHEYLPRDFGRPMVITLHLPPEWYPDSCFDENVHFVCVSDSQRRFCPPNLDARVIPNGIPIPEFRVLPKKRSYVLCLGRICPEKGFHLALDATAQLNLPMILAGDVFDYETHQRYFREQILPRLGPNRRFIGPIGRARKHRLIAAAKCVVIPSLVNETSSLVAMEGLACGTPVVAFKHGALPSIVDHCRTGILIDDPSDLPEAIRASAYIGPEHCRYVARERFSCGAMTNGYLEFYRELVTKPSVPRSRAEAAVPI